MFNQSYKQKEPISDINIVPFVDIILVVLITFMVTAPYIARHGLFLNLPKASTSGKLKATKSSFSVALHKKGDLYLNGKKVSEREILKESKVLVKKNPMIQAVISADKDVSHGRVVKIIDLIKSSGILRFAITVDKK